MFIEIFNSDFMDLVKCSFYREMGLFTGLAFTASGLFILYIFLKMSKSRNFLFLFVGVYVLHGFYFYNLSNHEMAPDS